MIEIASPLEGLLIIVTRPRLQADKLVTLLQNKSADVLRLPLLEIEAIATDENALAVFPQSLEQYDICIFISRNAVKYATVIHPAPWPVKKLAAVGSATAAEMLEQGLSVDLHPEDRWDSESLLALADFQPSMISQKNILIVRGVGGREYLADTLRSRGAIVDYAQVYRRVCPEMDIEPVSKVLQQNIPVCILISSLESLDNLKTIMSQNFDMLCREVTPVVVSERIANAVLLAGFNKEAVIAHRADDNSILTAIEEWWLNNYNRNAL